MHLFVLGFFIFGKKMYYLKYALIIIFHRATSWKYHIDKLKKEFDK
jgi:hypothetical protein